MWTAIVVHHSATHDGPGLDSEAIRRYHTESNGWSDIGYHWLVERVGGVYAAVMGRPAHRIGSHAAGWNSRALGVCLVGDFSLEPPPAGQFEAAAQLCAGLCALTTIRPGGIYPHRAVRQTVCPGKLSVPDLRARVAELLAGAPAATPHHLAPHATT